jgi:hypothetical protein
MATVSDPSFSGFNADLFRSKIKSTMRMGLPNTTAERATFRWTVGHTFASADGGGSPWDFGATPVTTTAHADVQIDCAVDFVPRATLAGGTAVGHFDTPRAIITVLDEDYPDIVGADTVLLGENVYTIDFVAPPVGLFTVTIYQLHVSAQDET